MKQMTARDVRREFKQYWRDVCQRQPCWRNDKPAMREEFANYVDNLARGGQISERVAQNVTLEG